MFYICTIKITKRTFNNLKFKTMTTIDTSADTYLVEFQNKSNGGLICAYANLAEALKPLNEGRILKDIFRYNQSKRKFERVSKSKYSTLFGWNTEAIEILSKYIKF